MEQIKQHPWLNSDPASDQLIRQMSSLKIREKSDGNGRCCEEKNTTFDKNSIVGWENENNNVQDVNNKKRNGIGEGNKKQGKFYFFCAKGKTTSTFDNNKIAGENNRMLRMNSNIKIQM